MLLLRLSTIIVALLALVRSAAPVRAGQIPIQPLQVKGEDFVDPSGQTVRFWGVNLAAVYPDHARADLLAANLASREINLVRPHHILRPSLDLNPKMISGALVKYKDNSRDFDDDALDRFDYFNAALRRNGIYLAFSVHWTRKYLPGDVDIVPAPAEDREAWMAAMRELNGWAWKKSFDVYKMLPVVDERVALLNEEFVRRLLSHVNPYTSAAYARDPQVLTFEVMNETSTEYAVVCGNRLPQYWDKRLAEKWAGFATHAGITPGDLYKPADDKVRAVRAAFLRQLDQDYFERMKAVVRGTGCIAPMTFSNLWRGDNALQMHAEHADQIENHDYCDPLVVRGPEDLAYDLSKSALAGKPFFVGELNQAESSEAMARQSPVRTMLPLAASAYGSLHNWSGVVWFAWMHGTQMLGADGWGREEGRSSNLGQMIVDGMQIDHLRTTGILFKRGLVAKSTSPIILSVDGPLAASGYADLMRGKVVYRPGWQDIHAVRKIFGPASQEQAVAPWMTQTPPNPLVSDTGEIVKDIARQQLTVTAPKAEAFSGFLDEKAPAGLHHVSLEGTGFATVVVVADDGADLSESGRLIVSRTGLDRSNAEVAGPVVRLAKLKAPSGGSNWYARLTRPREGAALAKEFTGMEYRKLEPDATGQLQLPAGNWHECELHLRQ